METRWVITFDNADTIGACNKGRMLLIQNELFVFLKLQVLANVVLVKRLLPLV